MRKITTGILIVVLLLPTGRENCFGQAGAVIVNKGASSQLVQRYFANFIPGDRYYWYTFTGSNDIDPYNRLVKVYPNPAINGVISRQFNGFTAADRFTIALLDDDGRQLYKNTVSDMRRLTIHRNPDQGIYYVRVHSQKGTTTKKVLIK
jgi:hypothetical protein